VLEDFARDAAAAVRFLRDRKEIDPERIGLLGHSEGGTVAPLAAGSEEVAFVVLLAGSGVRGDQILERQAERLARQAGARGEPLERMRAHYRKTIDLLKSGADSATVGSAVRELVVLQLAACGQEMPPERVEVMAQQGAASLLSPWFRRFVAYDPAPALRGLKVPVLALNGELDLQVDPDQNLPAIEAVLREGGNPDVTVRRLAGLNHLLQTAQTGAVEEYGTIEETMSPLALSTIREWIATRFVRG
jgi:pimeloyl-ACP methyl ester carboxylesterase